MKDRLFELYFGNELVASNMHLDDAILFAKCLLEEYYNELKEVIIKPMKVCEGNNE